MFFMNNIDKKIAELLFNGKEFGGLISTLEIIEDPRIDRNKLHPLESILAIYLCATICGREGWDEVYDFAVARQEELELLVCLPHGIPSPFTFARVIERINTKLLQDVTNQWRKSAINQANQKQIAIDGKALRGSKTQENNGCYIVNAWDGISSMVLAQQKVQGKGHELEGMKFLVRNMDLKDTIVSMDALGCQTELAEIIIRQKGNYLFALKMNQKALYTDVKNYFNEQLAQKSNDLLPYQTIEKGHGRIEKREYFVSPIPSELESQKGWKKLTSIGTVISSCTRSGKTSVQQRYFISSAKFTAENFAYGVRNHWSIENSLHWVLDVDFREDACRIRRGFAPENVSWFRCLALSLLKQEPSKKSIRKKMFLASDDFEYLLKVLLSKGC
jgi:predicted transposase YbfD/YdcC